MIVATIDVTETTAQITDGTIGGITDVGTAIGGMTTGGTTIDIATTVAGMATDIVTTGPAGTTTTDI